jgi:hypothetical protein
MLTKKFFQIVHYFTGIISLIIFILVPLIYIKYIALLPLIVAFSWIIFNGCIIDKLHHDNANRNATLTDNVTLFLNYLTKHLQNIYTKTI